MWYTNLPEMLSLEGSPFTTLEAHEALNTTLAKFLSITHLLQHSVHMRQWALHVNCALSIEHVQADTSKDRRDIHTSLCSGLSEAGGMRSTQMR
jgi:hypothetical protein